MNSPDDLKTATTDPVRAALEPFTKAAELYDEVPGVCRTDGDVELWQQPTRIHNSGLTIDHLRQARAALRTPAPLHSGETTKAEIQSGMDRQKWAENLILQLPVDHDGRNNWLLNFGRTDFARDLRKQRGLAFDERSQAINPPTSPPAIAPEPVKLTAETIPNTDAARQFSLYELAPDFTLIDRDPQADVRLKLYRDIFAEITAKAIPVSDPSSTDPDRVQYYRIPIGPLHRAAGKLGFQLFNGEQHLANAVKEIARLKSSPPAIELDGGVVAKIKAALFEPEQSDAYDNLDGALIDIERLSEQGKPTDVVCIRTIRRVLAQLNAVHNILAVALTAPKPERAVAREVTDEDRNYASELVADLANGDLPKLECAARWFRKARLETLGPLAAEITAYARDLRRNSSGGDDYPWEIMRGVANNLDAILKRHQVQGKSQT